MKSCISLYSYWPLVMAKKMTHYQVIDTIKSLGIDAVELQIFDPAVPKGMTMGEYAKEDAEKLVAELKEAGAEAELK